MAGGRAAPAGFASALTGILRSLTGDVRIVVLRAADWASRAGTPSGGAGELDPAAWQTVLRWLDRPDLISVAVIEGPAAGDRLALALACDLRLISEDATLRLAEPRAGLAPAVGVAGALLDLVGYARALELCLTGRPVGADEAARLGLASRVLPRSRLDAGVDEFVRILLAVPSAAATETKALLRGIRPLSDRDRREAEAAALARCLDAIRSGEVGPDEAGRDENGLDEAGLDECHSDEGGAGGG